MNKHNHLIKNDLDKDISSTEVKKILDRQRPIVLGNAINDDYFDRLGFDFSGYSGIQLEIITSGSVSVHKYINSHINSKHFLINQQLLNAVFSKSDGLPRLAKLEDAEDPEELLLVDVHVYPLLSLDVGVIYKLDLSIGERKAKEGYQLMNVLQKHFFSDKSCLFFRDQLERSLMKCFDVMKEAFLEIKDKKVFLVTDDKEHWEFLERCKKQKKEEEKSSSNSEQVAV